MNFHLYKITNNVTGKIYIGVHQTKNINDSYMGSGKRLRDSIKHHGIDNFTKEILETFQSSEEMYAREKEVVTEEFIASDDNYNLRVGGSGGFDYIRKMGLHKNPNKVPPWNKGKVGVQTKSTETREKMSKTLKEKYANQEHHLKGREPSNKGKKGLQVAWNKGLPAEKFVCPHCGREIAGVNNFNRWHNSNCKKKVDI